MMSEESIRSLIKTRQARVLLCAEGYCSSVSNCSYGDVKVYERDMFAHCAFIAALRSVLSGDD